MVHHLPATGGGVARKSAYRPLARRLWWTPTQCASEQSITFRLTLLLHFGLRPGTALPMPPGMPHASPPPLPSNTLQAPLSTAATLNRKCPVSPPPPKFPPSTAPSCVTHQRDVEQCLHPPDGTPAALAIPPPPPTATRHARTAAAALNRLLQLAVGVPSAAHCAAATPDSQRPFVSLLLQAPTPRFLSLPSTGLVTHQWDVEQC